MDTGRWHALETGFATALALQGADRDRWLAECEAKDPSLAMEIRGLLDADGANGALDRLGPHLGSLHQLIGDVDESESRRLGDVPLPTQVGPYVVAGEIGRGGMGVVCRAHDPRLGRDVALKIFPLRAAGAAAEVERRVLTEARAASALDHSNICTIYDVGSLDDGRPYLAMAYYPGGTLAERLTHGPLPIRDAITIALQIADALSRAHTAGIVHRDVKPRNVAFGDRGEAKLLDFGVALLRDQSAVPNSAGTPAYMAPEQVRGDTVDARADVWALGVVLYEMLTGQRPFGGRGRDAVMHAILHESPPDIRTLRPEVPTALADVVSHALRKAPAERPAGAADVGTALRTVLDADQGPRAAPAARTSRAKRVAIAFAVVVGFVLAASVVWEAVLPTIFAPNRADRQPLGANEAAVRDLFERARERERTGGAQGVEEAIQLLQNVLDRDSAYAPAHALLARAYARSVVDGMSRQGTASFADSAMMHAERATAIAPELADGHAALGFVNASLVRHADAVPHYLRALQLDPKAAETMIDLTRSYMALDRYDEGVVWQERALAVDPMLPGARVTAIGRYHVWELFDHAWRHVEEGLRLVPTDVAIHSQAMMMDLFVDDTASARRRFDAMQPLLTPAERARLGITFEFGRRNLPGARDEVDRLVGTGSTSQDFLTYGVVYRATGDRARGDSLLRLRIDALRAEDQRLGQKSTHVAAALAHAYSALGEREMALRTFARWDSLGGVESRRRMNREFGWETLRTDPRWEAIMARMDARFQAGRELMRSSLARALPRDSAARATQLRTR